MKTEQKMFNFQLTTKKDLNNWALSLLPILTIELTFACVPAAEGDQSDNTDEQDTASTYCSSNNYQYRQGFFNRNSNRKKNMWNRGVGEDSCQEKGGMKWEIVEHKCQCQKRADQSKRKKEFHLFIFLIPETSAPI